MSALLHLINLARGLSRRPPAPAESAVDRFAACLPIILRHEGGFVNDPRDPGGATNMGITHRTLSAWRGKPSVTRQQVKDLAPSEAAEIYKAWYWGALCCDRLPAGVDLVVFDFGVNAGTRRSACFLQRLVGVKQDGFIGPQTIAAVKHMDPIDLIAEFSEARMGHYRSLKTWPVFKVGWSKRTKHVEHAAYEMVK